MRVLFLSLFCLLSLEAMAAKIECSSSEHKISIQSVGADLKVTYKGETALGDGLLSMEEVDLVARFSNVGEMTLFAKIGKVAPENYLFIQGKRFSVICR